MNYKHITCFQNKKRSEFLKQYRDFVLDYFDNIGDYMDGRFENERARQLRSIINHDMEKAVQIVRAANLTNHYEAHDRYIGMYVYDIVGNLFDLPVGISYMIVIDLFNNAIGVYENDRTRSILRTINPVFYVDHLFRFIASVVLYPIRLFFPHKNSSKLEDFVRYLEYIVLAYQLYGMIAQVFSK
ncbi:MAG: hypothetical protein LHW60_07385 [Candidatus Cloacimonetes bacterium]|nr:hypothetical protein [Candidatus Cloacimonadota bacterium]